MLLYLVRFGFVISLRKPQYDNFKDIFYFRCLAVTLNFETSTYNVLSAASREPWPATGDFGDAV